MNQAQLAERMAGIGGSDAPDVCGVGFRSALEVWLEKTGKIEPEGETKAMRWGKLLEPVLASAYADETGREIEIADATRRHPDYSWMLCHLDRKSCAPAPERIVELKTANAFVDKGEWGEPGTDEIPECYLVQVNHQMAVTGMDLADVAVLIGGQDFRVYTVSRNEILIARMLEIESDFWAKVKNGIRPDPDWQHPRTLALLDAMYRPKDGLAVDLPPDAVDLVNAYESAGDRASDAKEAKDQIKAELIHMLADASLGRLTDGRTITRKAVNRKSYTVEATTYYDLRIKKARKVKA